TITGPSGTWDSGGMDIALFGSYAINGGNVLTAQALGSGVADSSLTSVGTLLGLTMGGNIVMADNSVTGIDTLTFTDAAGTIAGIQNQNLLDKTATESVSGEWTFSDKVFIDGSTAGDIQLTVQGATSQSDNIFVVEISSGADGFVIDKDLNALLKKHTAMGSGGSISAGRVLNLIELKADSNLIGAFINPINSSSSGSSPVSDSKSW
ncbi:hypothetical protein LCGC14_2840740, partial [marine sediment metagenome]